MSVIQVELPDEVLEKARAIAEEQQMTLDEFVADILNDLWQQREYLRIRANRGRQVTRERFLEILAKAPDVEPEPGDRIE